MPAVAPDQRSGCLPLKKTPSLLSRRLQARRRFNVACKGHDFIEGLPHASAVWFHCVERAERARVLYARCLEELRAEGLEDFAEAATSRDYSDLLPY
jgi:hypothetical protein